MAHGDAKKFESIPGIGKKLAQRLMVELKDKVGVGTMPPALPAPVRRRARPTFMRRARRCRTSA